MSVKETAEATTTIALSNAEWAAVGSLLHLALDAGCPSTNARSAYNKIIAECALAAIGTEALEDNDENGNIS